MIRHFGFFVVWHGQPKTKVKDSKVDILTDPRDQLDAVCSLGVHPAIERKVKSLQISVPRLASLLQEGSNWSLVSHHLPADARFLRWRFDGANKDLVVTVWSESFPEVPPGGSIVDLDPPGFRQSRKTP